MTDHVLQPGPVHLLRLATGDDLYEAISRHIHALEIRSATLTCLGAVRRAAFRYYDQAERRYRDLVIDEPLEVAAGVGNVSLLEGAPFLHLHAVFSAEDGRAFGGHVNVGTEVFALEVHLHELLGDSPVRVPDDCTGLSLWDGTAS